VPAREHNFQGGHLFKESPSHYIAGGCQTLTHQSLQNEEDGPHAQPPTEEGTSFEMRVSSSPSQNGNTDSSSRAPPVSGMDTLLRAMFEDS
jgi:hypothetical protein